MALKIFPPSRTAEGTGTSTATPCGKKRWHLRLLLLGLLLAVSFENLGFVVYSAFDQKEDQIVEQQNRKMKELGEEKQRHLDHFLQQEQRQRQEATRRAAKAILPLFAQQY